MELRLPVAMRASPPGRTEWLPTAVGEESPPDPAERWRRGVAPEWRSDPTARSPAADASSPVAASMVQDSPGLVLSAHQNLRGQGTYIRNNFNYYNTFNRGWYTNHPGAWFAAGWAAGAAWSWLPWTGWMGYCALPADTAPIYYDYGDNVTYQGDDVYYGDQVDTSQQQYASQAAALVSNGQQAQPAPDEKWQALGVFAMVKGDESTSNDLFQLALNNGGILRGNYYNAATDVTKPVFGSLDKRSQRVAWSIQDKPDTVYETGLYNLTRDETTMLAHLGKSETEQYKLFRIQQPQDEASSSGGDSANPH